MSYRQYHMHKLTCVRSLHIQCTLKVENNCRDGDNWNGSFGHDKKGNGCGKTRHQIGTECAIMINIRKTIYLVQDVVQCYRCRSTHRHNAQESVWHYHYLATLEFFTITCTATIMCLVKKVMLNKHPYEYVHACVHMCCARSKTYIMLTYTLD
jgi:hypothetical protein